MQSMTAAIPLQASPDPADENVRAVAKALLAMTGRSRAWLAARLGLELVTLQGRFAPSRPSRFTVAEVAAMARIFGVQPQAFFEPPAALLRPDVASVVTDAATDGNSGRYRHLRVAASDGRRVA